MNELEKAKELQNKKIVLLKKGDSIRTWEYIKQSQEIQKEVIKLLEKAKKGCKRILDPELPFISYRCGDFNKIYEEKVYCKKHKETIKILKELLE